MGIHRTRNHLLLDYGHYLEHSGQTMNNTINDAIKLLRADLVWSGDFEEIKQTLIKVMEANLNNPDKLVLELAERLTRA